MAYSRPASPAPKGYGPSRKSETETLRLGGTYAVIQRSSIRPPYSPALTHSARSHIHSSRRRAGSQCGLRAMLVPL